MVRHWLLFIICLCFLAGCDSRLVPQVVPLDNSSSFTLRPTPVPVSAHVFANMDASLAAIVAQEGLTPFPGKDVQEGDTPLAQLGQQLFFDPILSGDQNISCATCHHPTLALADGRVLPIGTGGRSLGPQRTYVDTIEIGPEANGTLRSSGETRANGFTRIANPFDGFLIPRNSPTVLNAALLDRQFWDGRVDGYARTAVQTLEDAVNRLGLSDPLTAQALFPISSVNEMAGATLGSLPKPEIRRILAARLEAIPAYREQFSTLFGPSDDGSAVTPPRMAAALAAFERRLIFTVAPWDRYLSGATDALTDQQKRGALLFYGAAKDQVNCAQCHSGDLFTDLGFYNLLVPQLGPGKGHGYAGHEDWGRAGFTFDNQDRYAFRTPSLRNVSLTAPYFHSGAVSDLEGAIRYHAQTWNSAASFDPTVNDIPPEMLSSLRPFDPDHQGLTAASTLANGLPLSDGDIDDLVAFLDALTDPDALDLTWLIPESVPSGLPLDILP